MKNQKTTNELFKHSSKADWYINHGRRKEKDIYKSNRYYLKKKNLNNKSVLEIGCAAGGLYEVVEKKTDNVKYTGLDISPKEIKVASKRYPEAKFIHGDFLKMKMKPNAYDVVCSFHVLPHQKNYREFLAKLIEVAAERVIVDIRLRHDGETVVDLDTSYVYYHWSGKRQYYVVCNLYEILNYLNIEKFGLKKISIYGYYAPEKTSGFVPMPKSKMLTACMCLEKYGKGEKIKRLGGHTGFSERKWCDIDIKLPDFSEKDF